MKKIEKGRIALLIILSILGTNFLYSQINSGGIQKPILLSQPELKFPNQALMGRVVGEVWVKVLVGKDGIPIKTKIVKREPEMAYLFDNSARKWAMQCRFTSAKNPSGNPISTWVVFPLSFKLNYFLPPECIKLAEPKYPEEANEMGLEGWVGLAVFVKSDGNVDLSETIVIAREPENTSIFDKAAKEAAYHSQFRAARYEVNAIEGWCFVKVSFKLTKENANSENENE